MKPTEFRRCPRHGLTEFALYGQAVARWRCKRCIGEAVTRRHQKVRRMLVSEAGGCCSVCGYDRCELNLHFHHVDPQSKAFALNSGIGKSMAASREEARKCVLVCANCHGEIEGGLIESPPPGAKYGERGSVAIPAAILRFAELLLPGSGRYDAGALESAGRVAP